MVQRGSFARVVGALALCLAAGVACGQDTEPNVAPLSAAPTQGPEQFGGQAAVSAPPGTVDGYCAAIRRAQAEESAPPVPQDTGTDSARALRRLQDIANASPAEIRPDWQMIIDTTNKSLQMLAAASSDISKLDRRALLALRQQAVPAAQRVGAFTKQRCGFDYTPPV